MPAEVTQIVIVWHDLPAPVKSRFETAICVVQLPDSGSCVVSFLRAQCVPEERVELVPI